MSFQIDFQGIDLIRGRDCVVFSKGDGYSMSVSQEMLSGGWVGGQGAQWDTYTDPDNPILTYSSGLFGGFMLWGSDEAADQYTAMTQQPLYYGYGVLMAGRAIISTIAYEQYTYASRMMGGPFVSIVYTPNQPLFMSLRGYWTNEDELTLSASPLAPALYCGVVSQLPKAVNQYYLGVQTKL
jgi:hypothetical protein